MFCRISARRAAGGDRVGGRVAIRRDNRIGDHGAGAAVLVPRADAEVFGVLQHVLVGTADRSVRPALDGLEVRVEVRPQVVGRDVREVRAGRSVAQDDRAGGRGCGGVADLRARVGVGGQISGRERGHRDDRSDSACLRKPGPVAERSAPAPPRASASVPVVSFEVSSAGISPAASAATVTPAPRRSA